MIKKFQLPRSEFARNVLVMMTGTTIAQAIPVAVSPILTRLYTPEDFGLLALYMSLLLLLSSVVTLKYDQAINLPVDDKEAAAIVILCGLIAILTSSSLFILVFFFANNIASLLGNDQIARWLYVLPVSVMASGMTTSLSYWFNRRKRFSTISRSRVAQSAGTAAAQLGLFHYMSKSGILVGAILGQLGAVFFLALSSYKDSFKIFRVKLAETNLTAELTKYRKFPFFHAPAVFLETASAQLPVVVITMLFGASAVGMFALAQRVIRLPIIVISASFGEVFRQAASQAYATKGDARPIFIKSLQRLALLSFFPFVMLFIFSPFMFSIVFGPDWRAAGEIARILTPMIWLSFIVSPLSLMFIIAEKQEIGLIFQGLLIGASFIALWSGYFLFRSLDGALTLFVLVYSFKYIVQLFLSYRFCLRKDQ